MVSVRFPISSPQVLSPPTRKTGWVTCPSSLRSQSVVYRLRSPEASFAQMPHWPSTYGSGGESGGGAGGGGGGKGEGGGDGGGGGEGAGDGGAHVGSNGWPSVPMMGQIASARP